MSKREKMLKALADENRLKIMDTLVDGDRCACAILEKMDICQSTLSHHMKILCDSEVVLARKDGRWVYYSINPELIGFLQGFLDRYK